MSQAIASSQPPPRAWPRTAAISGLRMRLIRSQRWKWSSTVRLVGVWTASSLMSAPAANARSPAPVMTIARQAESPSSASRASVSSVMRAKFRAFRTSGRSRTTRATPSRSPDGALAGNVTRTRGSAGWLIVPPARFATVSRRRQAGRKSASEEVRGVLDDEEGRETRGDVAEDPAGLAHRVGAEGLVHRGPVVEVEGRREREICLAPEGAGDAPDSRPAQSRGLGDQRQVLVTVTAFEGRERLFATVRTAVQDEQGRHRLAPSGG